MSHTQDMVMIKPAISLEMFEGKILVFVKQSNPKILSSTCVQVTADISKSQELPQERHQEHPKGPKW